MFGSSSRPATRRTLRVEALDGRVLPGGLAGGVIATGGLTVAAHGADLEHIGEEIPQTVSIRDGHVDFFAGRGGISGDV